MSMMQQGQPLYRKELPAFPAGWKIVCDFDGTVTPFDVTDAILERFADHEWEAVEAEWLSGKISARTCMERQTALIRAPRRDLDAFLDTVPVDKGFAVFVALCRGFGLDMCIMSDGLDYAIRRILDSHGLGAVPVVANRLVLGDETSHRLEFPYGAENCGSGVCKCQAAGKGKILLIGDSRSDFCLAGKADYVLAREGMPLAAHCRENGYLFSTYRDFNDVHSFVASRIKSSLKWTERRKVPVA